MMLALAQINGYHSDCCPWNLQKKSVQNTLNLCIYTFMVDLLLLQLFKHMKNGYAWMMNVCMHAYGDYSGGW